VSDRLVGRSVILAAASFVIGAFKDTIKRSVYGTVNRTVRQPARGAPGDPGDEPSRGQDLTGTFAAASLFQAGQSIPAATAASSPNEPFGAPLRGTRMKNPSCDDVGEEVVIPCGGSRLSRQGFLSSASVRAGVRALDALISYIFVGANGHVDPA